MMNFSHIKRDLEELKEAREKDLADQAHRFDPDCFGIKDQAERKRRALEDDFVFNQMYFPEWFTKPPGEYHRQWAKIFDRRAKEIHNIQGFRESGKTFQLRAKRIKNMLFGTVKHVVRVGETIERDSEAEVIMTMIEFEMNPRLLHDFGDMRDRRFWKASKLRLKNGVVMTPLAPGIKARGLTPRPDWVEIDDFEDLESAANPDRGKFKLDWLIQELYGAISDDGIIIWLANNLSLDSACNQFESLIREAAESGEPKIKFFYHKYPATRIDENGNEVSCWPEGKSVEDFKIFRSDVGTAIWEAEMQQNPMRPGDKFKPEWLIYVEMSEVERTKEKRRCGQFLDPSYGETNSACYKAIIFGSSDGQYFDVMDVWIRQSSVKAMCHAWFEMIKRWSLWNIMFAKFESIMNQKILMRDFKEIAEERGEVCYVSGVSESDEWFKLPKPTRIEQLSMPIETGRIRFVRRNGQMSADMKRLIEQLLNYPKGAVDGPDALASWYKLMTRVMNTNTNPVVKTIQRMRRWRSR